MILYDVMKNKLNFTFESFDNVGIFNIIGELSAECEDELKLLLMRAIHGSERAVLNMKKVTSIDMTCFSLLRKAYCTSIRLKNPIIITDVPSNYITEIYKCEISDDTKTGWSPEYQESAV
jgi:anti-anti-sigma regulatory factor